MRTIMRMMMLSTQVVPNVMCIALYSPPLDSIGNSVRGQQFCKVISIYIAVTVTNTVTTITITITFTSYHQDLHHPSHEKNHNLYHNHHIEHHHLYPEDQELLDPFNFHWLSNIIIIYHHNCHHLPPSSLSSLSS